MRSCKLPRPRRLLLIVVGLYLLYLFFKNMPTDLAPAVERYDPELARARRNPQKPLAPVRGTTPPQNPPVPGEIIQDIGKSKDADDHDGDIELVTLTESLMRLPKLGPEAPFVSRSVVFAGSDLSSISDLIPLACQMAHWKKNVVNFVLMGRSEVSIDGIRQVNAVDDVNCPILWHGMAQKRL